jgi:hypothetical protein
VLVKDTAYREKVQNVNVLRDRIVRAAERVLPAKCLRIPGTKTEYGLDTCRATNGDQPEIC